jgi:RNA polymerase sigma-70 factor (ECF subfamily)
VSGEQSTEAARTCAVEEFYQAHVRPLYAFIFHRVGNREAAEDLTADVFLRALEHVDPTREEQSIAAWLYRVARNAVNDYWRAGRGAQVLSLDQVRPLSLSTAQPDMVRQERTQRRARALLLQLPEHYRAVLQHRLIEGLSLAETAALMATSVGNVKVLQHRALKRAAALRDDEDVDE